MKLVQQRGEGDCGVAALAMLAEQSYEDAYLAVTEIDPRRGKSGLYVREIIAAARRLGLQLRPTRQYDLDDDDGILKIKSRRSPRNPYDGHYVIVRHGLIICPTYLEILPWRDYLERCASKAATLLKIQEATKA